MLPCMTTNPNGKLYEATPVDILCNVAVIGVVPNTTGYTITRQWLGSTPITAGPEYIPLPIILFTSINSVELVITTGRSLVWLR